MAHEVGMLVAFMTACICLTYLSYKGWGVTRKRWKFDLRDLFVALTLAVAVFALMIGAANQDRDGIPRFSLAREIDRLYGPEAHPEP